LCNYTEGKSVSHGKYLSVNAVSQEDIIIQYGLYPEQFKATFFLVMLKTFKCPVRVVRVFRKTQWIAIFPIDLDLSIEQIIEYYGTRWKIESGFKELKQDIGSNKSQSRNAHAVGRNSFAFSDLRHIIARTALTDNLEKRRAGGGVCLNYALKMPPCRVTRPKNELIFQKSGHQSIFLTQPHRHHLLSDLKQP